MIHEEERQRLISDICAILVNELSRTIPPSFDPMRAIRFEKAAERSVKLCIDRLAEIDR